MNNLKDLAVSYFTSIESILILIAGFLIMIINIYVGLGIMSLSFIYFWLQIRTNEIGVKTSKSEDEFNNLNTDSGTTVSKKEWEELHVKKEESERDNYISCKNCGYINLESDEYCEDCGTELTLNIDINQSS